MAATAAAAAAQNPELDSLESELQELVQQVPVCAQQRPLPAGLCEAAPPRVRAGLPSGPPPPHLLACAPQPPAVPRPKVPLSRSPAPYCSLDRCCQGRCQRQQCEGFRAGRRRADATWLPPPCVASSCAGPRRRLSSLPAGDGVGRQVGAVQVAAGGCLLPALGTCIGTCCTAPAEGCHSAWPTGRPAAASHGCCHPRAAAAPVPCREKKDEARQMLAASVSAYPCNWSAWLVRAHTRHPHA